MNWLFNDLDGANEASDAAKPKHLAVTTQLPCNPLSSVSRFGIIVLANP